MPARAPNPAPLTVAASLVVIQGGMLLMLAGLELAHVSSERISLGVSTAVFVAAYGGI